MFDLEWQNKSKFSLENTPNPGFVSKVDNKKIKRVLSLLWKEHCVECAVPECYSTCQLYEKRSDGDCARFVYGVYPNPSFSGRFEFGADIKFRRWGKLEACLHSSPFASKPWSHKNLQRFYNLPRVIRRAAIKLANSLVPLNSSVFDEFVLECFSPSRETFKLFLEYFTEDSLNLRITKFRHSISIKPGHNLHTIPFSHFSLDPFEGYLFVIPEEGEGDKRLIFTWLDFVKYKKSPQTETKAEKVKCLAWDLDNTIWKGILAEDNEVKLNTQAVEIIKELDQRGILHTIISKNHYEEAWSHIQAFGLSKYFLYPAINWGQKSENLRKIAQYLNIGINSFALIDDSKFERAEIRRMLPAVRLYSDTEMSTLLSLPEFDVPITETSIKRRESYQKEIKRNQIMASFSGSYEEFLLSCKMQMDLIIPKTSTEVNRCLELIQRSNQLNLSSKRYSNEELNEILANNNILTVAFRCKDKFGDYGIVGFSTVILQEEYPILTDFLISCRIAQKRVEHAYFKWLFDYLSKNNHNYSALRARLLKTAKNQPLRQVFEDMAFTLLEEKNNTVVLEKKFEDMKKSLDIVEVNWHGENGDLRK